MANTTKARLRHRSMDITTLGGFKETFNNMMTRYNNNFHRKESDLKMKDKPSEEEKTLNKFLATQNERMFFNAKLKDTITIRSVDDAFKSPQESLRQIKKNSELFKMLNSQVFSRKKLVVQEYNTAMSELEKMRKAKIIVSNKFEKKKQEYVAVDQQWLLNRDERFLITRI